jgi:transcriptional regulator with XRE-family HTH domain
MLTGREMAQRRAVLGVSARQVAQILRVSSGTLQRWESTSVPVAPDLAYAWKQALEVAARERADDLRAQGIDVSSISTTEAAKVLAAAGWGKDAA